MYKPEPVVQCTKVKLDAIMKVSQMEKYMIRKGHRIMDFIFLFNGDNPYGVFQPSDCLGLQNLIRGESDKMNMQVEEDKLWIREEYFSVCFLNHIELFAEFYLDKIQRGQISVIGQTDGGQWDFDNKIELLEFVKDLPEENGNAGYEQFDYGLQMKMNTQSNVLKICSKYPKKEVQSVVTGNDKPERLNIVQIGDILDVDMYGQKLFPILKTLVAKNISFSFHTEMVHLVGHSMEVPCSKIKTADFSIIFDIHSVLQVKLGKDIAGASSLITTHNNRILVSDILKLAQEDTAKSIRIRVQGANNAWHFVYKNDEECVYHVGFDF